MSEPILANNDLPLIPTTPQSTHLHLRLNETRCASCGRVSRNADGCEYPDGWYLGANGEPRCPDCESAYRRIAGKLANLASEAGDGQAEIEFRRRSLRGANHDAHDCMEHAVYVTTDGPIGHGWECGKCGKFLQAG